MRVNMKEKQIKFKYKFSKDYNPIYVNGAHGGLTGRDEIIVNFFLERQGLPISQTHSITEDGKLGDETSREPEDYSESMIRYVSTGVVLNLESAKSIYDWLGNQIKNLEKIAKIKEQSKK